MTTSAKSRPVDASDRFRFMAAPRTLDRVCVRLDMYQSPRFEISPAAVVMALSWFVLKTPSRSALSVTLDFCAMSLAVKASCGISSVT